MDLNKKNILRLLCFSAIKKLVIFLVIFYSSSASALSYEDYPVVKLRSLDKITARTMTFEAKVGSTFRFGQIYIKVQSCRKPPPVEKSEAAAFLQIWQADELKNTSKWIFSGWMFASSPALSPMDHPVYDVWVLDCLGRDPEPIPVEQTSPDAPDTDGDAPDAVPPPVEPDTVRGDVYDTTSGDVTAEDDPGAFENTEGNETPTTYAPSKETPDTYQDDAVNGMAQESVQESAPVTADPQYYQEETYQEQPYQEQPAAPVQQQEPDNTEFQGIY